MPWISIHWRIRSIFVIAQPLKISITAKHEPFPPFISLTPHSRHIEIPMSVSVPKSPLCWKCTCVKSNWYAEFLKMHCFRVSRLKLHSFERCIQMCSVCGLFYWIAELVLNGKMHCEYESCGENWIRNMGIGTSASIIHLNLRVRKCWKLK